MLGPIMRELREEGLGDLQLILRELEAIGKGKHSMDEIKSRFTKVMP